MKLCRRNCETLFQPDFSEKLDELDFSKNLSEEVSTKLNRSQRDETTREQFCTIPILARPVSSSYVIPLCGLSIAEADAVARGSRTSRVRQRRPDVYLF